MSGPSPTPRAEVTRTGAPTISITIPAYNEEVTLERVVREAQGAAAEHFGDDYEVLIVDDGSSDDTAAIADRLAATRTCASSTMAKPGFSGAMLSCLEQAVGDYVFLGPADGQADFGDIARFWELVDRFDLIFGCRVRREESPYRKGASTVWYAFIRALFGAPIPEFSSLFCFKREAVPAFPVRIRPDAANFLPVLYVTAVRSGTRVGTLELDPGPRRGGEAKGGRLGNAVRTVAEDITLAWRLRRQLGGGVGGMNASRRRA